MSVELWVKKREFHSAPRSVRRSGRRPPRSLYLFHGRTQGKRTKPPSTAASPPLSARPPLLPSAPPASRFRRDAASGRRRFEPAPPAAAAPSDGVCDAYRVELRRRRLNSYNTRRRVFNANTFLGCCSSRAALALALDEMRLNAACTTRANGTWGLLLYSLCRLCRAAITASTAPGDSESNDGSKLRRTTDIRASMAGVECPDHFVLLGVPCRSIRTGPRSLHQQGLAPHALAAGLCTIRQTSYAPRTVFKEAGRAFCLGQTAAMERTSRRVIRRAATTELRDGHSAPAPGVHLAASAAAPEHCRRARGTRRAGAQGPAQGRLRVPVLTTPRHPRLLPHPAIAPGHCRSGRPPGHDRRRGGRFGTGRCRCELHLTVPLGRDPLPPPSCQGCRRRGTRPAQPQRRARQRPPSTSARFTSSHHCMDSKHRHTKGSVFSVRLARGVPLRLLRGMPVPRGEAHARRRGPYPTT